jgi:hypothetical protein
MLTLRLIVIILLATTSLAFAQEADTDKQAEANGTKENPIIFEDPARGGVFYFIVGSASPDMDALNKRLETAGYSKLSRNFTTYGLGGHAIVDKWVIGGELVGFPETSASNATYATKLSGGYLLVNLGYEVYKKPSLRVYPQVGLGSGSLTLTVNDNSTATFDQTLASPPRGTSMHVNSMILNLALAADGIISPPASGKGGFFVFGFRAGYLITLFQDDWRNSQGAIAGGPSGGFTGPYVEIVLGGGFFN